MISSFSTTYSGYAYKPPSPTIAPAAPADGQKGPTSDDASSEARLRASAANAAGPAFGTEQPDAAATDGAQSGEPADRAGQPADEAPQTAATTDEETNEQGLTQAEQREVEELRERDREVRAHEQAHLAAAGQYARGGIQYTYERGPDSRMYAVGGKVSVDTSKVPDDPEATLRKAETLRRAALAPVEPSSQDRSVAADMTRMAAEARRDIAAETREEAQNAVDAATGVSAEQEDAGADPTAGSGQREEPVNASLAAYTQTTAAPSRTLARV